MPSASTEIEETGAATQDSKDERTQPFNSAERLSLYKHCGNTLDDDATESDDSIAESLRNKTPSTPSYSLAKKAATDTYVDYKISAARWDHKHESVTQDVILRIYRCAANTARFRLCTHIYPIKSNKNDNKMAVYLFIYPEDIRSIKLHKSGNRQTSKHDNSESHYSLYFDLEQKPRLVYAKDSVFDSKKKTKHCLDLMKGLASTKDFTLQIDRSSATDQAIEDLVSIASTFSFDRAKICPRLDDRRADLDTLYAGKGGKFLTLEELVADAEVVPPPYSNILPEASQSSRKRPRIDCNADAGHPPSAPNDSISPLIRDLQHIMMKGFNAINTRLDHITSRLDNVECNVKELADKIPEEPSNCPRHCRYNTEEREDLKQELDDMVDGGITDIKAEYEDTIDKLKQNANETREMFKRGLKRKMERLLDRIDEVATETIENKLQNANLQINWTGLREE